MKNREKYTPLNDEELVTEVVRTKNTELYEIIYDRYSAKIFNKCFSFSKDRAEAADLTHDIFLKIFLKLHTFSHKSKFSTWVYSITYNFCVDYEKKKFKERDLIRQYHLEQESYYTIDEISDDELFKIKADELRQLLEELRPQEKTLLILKYQDDHSISELAEITGLSESAVKMRLKRCKAKLLERHREVYVS